MLLTTYFLEVITHFHCCAPSEYVSRPTTIFPNCSMPVVFSQGHLCPQGSPAKVWRQFGCGCYWHVEGCWWTSCNAQDHLYVVILVLDYLAPNVDVAEVEKPCSTAFCGKTRQFLRFLPAPTCHVNAYPLICTPTLSASIIFCGGLTCSTFLTEPGHFSKPCTSCYASHFILNWTASSWTALMVSILGSIFGVQHAMHGGRIRNLNHSASERNLTIQGDILPQDLPVLARR